MKAAVPSLAKLKLNPAWAKLPLFDRTGWSRTTFQDCDYCVSERADPADAEIWCFHRMNQ
jgi:hypothetical protein